MYCNCYDKIDIYDKYNEKTSNTNCYLSSINSNDCHITSYNYKIGDDKLNKILKKIYKSKYIKFIEDIEYDECSFDFNKYMRNFDVLKPYDVKNENNHYCLYFNLCYKSKIWANIKPDNTSTQFKIIELKDITKTDYAYITLLFPSYDKDGQKKYTYLLGCLLVAYLLKTQPQNHDLLTKNKIGTKANIICMVTPDVEQHIINILKSYYDFVIVVPYIVSANVSNVSNLGKSNILITDISKGNINPKHPYNKVMTKLNIFNKKIFNYKKVIFIDSDLFPMGYYDSLFSLNTPAGCLEHRRYQDEEFGIGSWALDRGQFFKHGNTIPKMFTDLKNIYSSDINASLLVITPDNDIYQEMISELQKPINEIFTDIDSNQTKNSNQTKYKGFWLGNKFYNFYYLPEQNYLTQKFSGLWNSIDIGFSTWLIETEHCFGFTFAGFVVKPWEYQSQKHEYSINPYSLFSEINNKYTNRAYGYQIFNQYLCKMIHNSIKYKNELIYYLKKIKITDYPFDTWEPEINFNNAKLIKKYKINDIYKLSFDQKKIYYLISNNNKLKKILYFDYLFENICKHIYNIDYIALSYHILTIFGKIFKKLHLSKKVYPFGNTLNGIHNYKSFDVTDDDNDLIIIIKKYKYKEKILKLIKTVLNYNLQIYYRTTNLTEFIQIIPNNNKPAYYFTNNIKKCITYNEFKSKFDTLDFKLFNISLYKSQIDCISRDLDIITTSDMFFSSQYNVYKKSPWIDIFFLIDNYDKLIFNLNDNFKPSYDLFTNKYYVLDINHYNMNYIIYNDYIKEYYNNYENNKYYKIKSKHNNFLITEKNVLLKISKKNKIENDILLFIYSEINHHIKKIYNSINLIDYL